MNERLSKIVNHPKFVPITVGILSFGAGTGLGYILGKRDNNRTFIIPAQEPFDNDEWEGFLSDDESRTGLDKEIIVENSIVDHSDKVAKGEELVNQIIQKDIVIEPNEPEPVEVVTHTIFADDDDNWNYEEELKKRNPNEPYVLHKDEFYANESDYAQGTLTYYSGDNILVDEDETPIYNHDQIVGAMAFGHGSGGDPNVFYVRNDKRKAEYEILFDPGLYSVEVLGLEIEDNDRAKNTRHASHGKFDGD